jgi:hypothetical protein
VPDVTPAGETSETKILNGRSYRRTASECNRHVNHICTPPQF